MKIKMIKRIIFCLLLACTTYCFAQKQSRPKNKYGIMTTSGKIITPAIYDEAYWNPECEEPFMGVSLKGKYGIIGPDGKPIGKIKYDMVSIENYPLYAVYKGNYEYEEGKIGFIDRQGNEVIPCIYDSKIKINYELDWYIMEKDGKTGIIDSQNNLIFPFEYTEIKDYYGYGGGTEAENIALQKEGKWALATKEKEIITPFDYDAMELLIAGGAIATKGKEHCFLSTRGQEIEMMPKLKPAGKNVQIDENSFTFQVESVRGNIIDLYGLVAVIDSTETIRLYTYEGEQTGGEYKGMPDSFYRGTANIKTPEGYIAIDTTGNQVLAGSYTTPADKFGIDRGLTFFGGVAIILNEDGYPGAINQKGELLIPFENRPLQYTYFFGKDGRHAPYFFLINEEGKKSVLDIHNQQITTGWYDEIDCQNGHYMLVTQNNKKGILSFDDKEIIPCEYDEIQPISMDLMLLKKEDKIRLFNIQTGTLSNQTFDKLERTNQKYLRIKENEFRITYGDYLLVEQNNKKGLIDTKGQQILPCEYHDIQYTSDGHFIITNEKNISTIIDKTGKTIRPYKKEQLTPLWDNLLLFCS